MWKDVVELDSPQMTIWCLHIACWITEATNAYSAYVILLFHCNKGCTNMSQCYVTCTLPVLLLLRKQTSINVFTLHTHTCCIKMH